jgi:hypothetical protein
MTIKDLEEKAGMVALLFDSPRFSNLWSMTKTPTSFSIQFESLKGLVPKQDQTHV